MSKKIESWDDLKQLRKQLNEQKDSLQTVLAVGMATCGVAAGAKDVEKYLNEEIEAQKVKDVTVVPTGCVGFCYAEPIVEVRMKDKEPVLYGNVDQQLAKRIIAEHIKQDQPITEHMINQEVQRA